eukprot:scaffold350115_cov44-Prasinocladus_malaysianus.AAC.1
MDSGSNKAYPGDLYGVGIGATSSGFDEGLRRRLLRSFGEVAVNFTTVAAFESFSGAGNRALLMYNGERFFYYDDHIKDAIAATEPSPPGQWHYVAVTVDSDGQGYLYINDASAVHFTTTSRPEPNAALTFCADMNPASGFMSDFFAGRLDSVRVYSSVLADPMGERFVDPSPSTASLAAHYKFEETGLTETSFFTQSFTSTPAPARMEGAYWVLSSSPFTQAQVMQVIPPTGALYANTPVAILGANFAGNQKFGCSVDGEDMPCKLMSPNLVVAFPVKDAISEATIRVSNGALPADNGAPYSFDVEVPDLQRGLVQHFYLGAPM